MAFLRRRGRTWYLVWKEGRRQFAKRVSRDRNIARERLRRFEEEADRAVAGLGRGDRYLSEASQDYHSRLR
ncbi:MAG TPA: hypothetical protein VNH84_06845, partial [Candidatus Saccharimonadales bacterium]|nr:hypothetical protein [Candidatus Saccharimonadales bacterium]